MRLPIALTLVHKWVGLVIGVQVVLWVAGGVVMSVFPIELVRGETAAARPNPSAITAQELRADLPDALAALGEVSVLRSVRVAGRLHFEAQRIDGPAVLIDAANGTIIDDIDEATARRVALADFTGQGGIATARLQTERSSEYRGALPVWQLGFDDARDTHIYVSTQNGQVVARRNDVWRLYDFFWMLHIMDYQDRTDFNHPLLIVAAVIALLLSLSGFWLLFYRIRLRSGTTERLPVP